jgi:hypothetical protein
MHACMAKKKTKKKEYLTCNCMHAQVASCARPSVTSDVSTLIRIIVSDHSHPSYSNRSVVQALCGGICSPGFKSSTWYGCSYFSGFISGFNGAMLGRRRCVCGDFRCAHRDRIYVHVFIWVSVRTCCERLCCTV